MYMRFCKKGNIFFLNLQDKNQLATKIITVSTKKTYTCLVVFELNNSLSLKYQFVSGCGDPWATHGKETDSWKSLVTNEGTCDKVGGTVGI